MDRRRQPPLIVIPDELTDLPEHVLNGVEGCCPIHFGFEPLPEALDRIIFRGIRLQVLKYHPCMLLEKAFDGTAFVNLGMIEDHDEQCFGGSVGGVGAGRPETSWTSPARPVSSSSAGSGDVRRQTAWRFDALQGWAL